MKGELSYEELAVHSGAVCHAADQTRHIGSQGMLKDGINEQIYYRRKKKYVGMGITEVGRMKVNHNQIYRVYREE